MLLNLIIIYMACGSPFGMYRIANVRRLPLPRFAATIGAHFILWPVFAAAILRRSLSEASAAKTDLEREIAALRSEIEAIAFAGSVTVSVFAFREVFTRYTGLTMALNNGAAAKVPPELLEIAKGAHPELARACLDRRNRGRLLFHQKRAQIEFAEMISVLTRSHLQRQAILDLALRLDRLLYDNPRKEIRAHKATAAGASRV